MSANWQFDQVTPGSVERNPVSEEFFTNDTRLEAIIRESIQNSLDAHVSDETPVEVRIYFSGDADKLACYKFKKYMTGGDKWFCDPKNGLTAPELTLAEDCQFLVVEDFNTTGLTGMTDEKPISEDVEHRNDWNYYNYFFRENGSTKFGAGTLGSWGAGKCVFQRASKIKTSFALSVRDGYLPRRFVVGKATLQHHQDADRITWAPDGWFGVTVPKDDDYPNRMLKRPIEDEGFIAQFKEDFNITRNDEPGTSIVIPHIHLATDSENEGAQFNQRNLVRAVLRNFLVAIHDNRLKVRIQVGKAGETTVIDQSTFEAYGSFLPEPEKRDALVTTQHHRLIIDVLKDDFPAAQRFNLRSPGDNPSWRKEMFDEEQLKAMQKILHEKKPILVTIPMPIRSKNAGGRVELGEAKFRVIIKRSELPKALPPVFYRVGLLIDSVATSSLNNYIAAVLIDRDKLADLLVAAEPPSHSKWNYDTDRVSKGYDKPRSHIQFVTYSVRNIIEQIASCDQQANWDPLSDVFGIKKPKEDNGNNDGKKPDDEGDDGNDAGGDVTQAEKLRIVAFSEINGEAKGIKVHDGPGLANVDDEKLPFKAKFAVGYDTFRGLSWTPNDFDLSNGGGGVKLQVKTGTAEVEGKGNSVVVTIKDKSPFSVEITGFDPNRDITAEKLRYDYTKQEVADGESL
jgi:hypothetical protein